jgi:hypothetical protein
MNYRLGRLVSTLVFILLFGLGGSLAYGQGSSAATISGVVVDGSGAVVPGADVTIKHTATGAVNTTVTGASGTFVVPALPAGNYTITIALMGFKTRVLNDVVHQLAVPTNVRAVLEIGALEETVVVQSGVEIVQTTSSSVATTVPMNKIVNMPLGSRSALDFVAHLPGVDTASDVRSSTVLGLPQSAINITLDGMNIQDNSNKTSDGFFTRVSPRLDAIEEVTVSTAGTGAEGSGQGAIQVRFTTRSGSNRFTGSGYYYYRDDKYYATSWFNLRDKLPKPHTLLRQPGMRMGGPIMVPKLFDGRNKAFFFFNMEVVDSPGSVKNDRDILTAASQNGNFAYAGGTVNLMDLASRTGNTSSIDPQIAGVLAAIRSAVATPGTGVIIPNINPAIERFTYQQPTANTTYYPTFRLDFNLTSNHRLSASGNWTLLLSSPDTTNSRQMRFPGMPAFGTQDSHRYALQFSMRSTIGKSIVNEFRAGGTGGPTWFNPDANSGMFDNQGGYVLGISAAMGISNMSGLTTNSSREASTKLIEDTLNWLKGSHSLSFGGSLTQAQMWNRDQTVIPTVGFGIVAGDPSDAMFSTANFPGSSSTDITNARNLYAVLTGRVSSITRDARIDVNTDKYVPLGQGYTVGRIYDMEFFAQDSWRARPNLSINAGLRYAIQLPYRPLNGSYSTATINDVMGITGPGAGFQPSTLVTNLGNLFTTKQEGRLPTYQQMTAGTFAYKTDKNNFAPSVGFNWTISADEGFLRKLVGQPGDTVLRGGFNMAYQRNGMADFTGVFGSNPGVSIDATRSMGNGNLLSSGQSYILLRTPGVLASPAIPESRSYPMSVPSQSSSVNMFDPNLKVPYAMTWTAGIQRAITRTMAAEVRYIGANNYAGWTTYNYNELNVYTSGMMDEFKLAQANLLANIAAGRGANFKYYGAGTGTNPLPFTLAYLVGSKASGDPAAYPTTSSTFANTTLVNSLAYYNPNPCCSTSSSTGSFVGLLHNDAARRANALTAGLPANFLVANPNVSSANITGNGGQTWYNSVQVELRKRMSHGFEFTANYTYGYSTDSRRMSFTKERVPFRQTGGGGGVTHAFKANYTIEVPFGQGRRFLSNAGPVLNRIIGGWTLFGLVRAQSGRLLDFGNVQLVGMTKDELANSFQLRIDGNQKVWMLPQDIIDNTIKAFSTNGASATGYSTTLGPPTGRYIRPANGPQADGKYCIETVSGWGDCGIRTLVVTGPKIVRFDLSVVKQIPVAGRINIELRGEVYNLLNRTNFTPVMYSGATADSYEVTGADINRQMQLVFRINW